MLLSLKMKNLRSRELRSRAMLQVHLVMQMQQQMMRKKMTKHQSCSLQKTPRKLKMMMTWLRQKSVLGA
jgi:hypothetical protein